MKYSRDDLRAMANRYLIEQERGNVMCKLLLVRLMLATGLSHEQCERGIKLLADRGYV